MDKDELIKWKILHFLYKIRKEGGPYETGVLGELAEELSIDNNIFIERYGLDLQDHGLIKIVDIGGGSVITPKGIALIDKKNPFANDYKSPDIKNISINAPVTGSAIVQGDNANVSLAIDFLDKFKEKIENSNLPEEEKKTWIERIKELSSNPALIEIIKAVLVSGA